MCRGPTVFNRSCRLPVRNMKNRSFHSLVALVAGLVCLAMPARSGQSGLLYGAVVFIASPSGSNMGAFLANQIAKHKIPVTISSEKPYASYILAAFVEPQSMPAPVARTVGQSHRAIIWKGKAVLADAQTRAIAWNAEFNGPCPPCDAAPERAEQIMATRFVKRLKRDRFSHESLSDHIDDFLAP